MLPRICLLALVTLTPAARAADWPQWLGPKRDGGTPEAVAAWKDEPKAAWRVPAGEGYSSPVVAGGRVFVHARVPDKDEEEVAAFDLATGKELWRDAYARPAYQSAVGTGPRATPAVAGGRLFTLGINGVLTCYEAATGKRVWQADVLKQFKADLPPFACCGSPLVVGDRVLVSVGGKGRCVVAFAAKTGEVLWQSLDDAASTSSPALFAGAAGPGAVPDVVYLTPLRLVGLNPLDGSLNWEHPVAFRPSGTSPTPIVVGGRVVTCTSSGGAECVKVTAGDEKATAEQEWQRKELAGYFSTGVASGDHLYLVTNTIMPLPSASVACVEAKTGKEAWRKSLGYFHVGLIRTGDGNLLCLDDAGNLRLIAGDPKEYHELAKAKVCRGTLVTPAFSGGRLVARDDKELICVELPPPAKQ